MEALKRANDIRSARAKLKKDLKAGKANIHALLLDPPEYVMTAKVVDMLLAVPKYGRVKSHRILNQCRIRRRRRSAGSPSASAPSSSPSPPLARPPRAVNIPCNGKGLRNHRPLGGRKGNADRRADERGSGARAFDLGDHAGSARGGGGRPRLPLPHRGGVRRAEGGRRVPRVRHHSGNRYGTLRSEVDRRLDAGHSVRPRDRGQGAQQVRAAMPESVRSSSPRLTRRPAPPARGAGHRLGRGDRTRLQTAEQELADQASSTTASSTTISGGRQASSSRSCGPSSEKAEPES